jgi:hypothetical protein
MGEIAEELDAELRAAMATTTMGQFVLEHDMLPPHTAPSAEETMTMLLQYQRVLGELLLRLAREVDELKADAGVKPGVAGQGDAPLES